MFLWFRCDPKELISLMIIDEVISFFRMKANELVILQIINSSLGTEASCNSILFFIGRMMFFPIAITYRIEPRHVPHGRVFLAINYAIIFLITILNADDLTFHLRLIKAVSILNSCNSCKEETVVSCSNDLALIRNLLTSMKPLCKINLNNEL